MLWVWSVMLIADDEASRLNALAQYRILDTVPEQAYNDVVSIAACVAQTPIALLTLIDRDRQWFKAKIGIRSESTPRQHSLCNYMVNSPDAVLVIPDTWQDERFAQNPLVLQEPWIRFYMGAPLVTEDRHVLGALCVVDRQPRQARPQEIEALAALLRQVMQLLELRRRNHEIRDLLAERSVQMQELSQKTIALQQHNFYLHTASRTDGLTGLPNRIALDQYLSETYARSGGQQQSFSVLFVDLDHFKSYNDQFGHPAGDEALRQVATLLRSICRKDDMAARYGGEEFVLVLPNTDRRAAQKFAERLRAQVANTYFPNRALTLSIGAATWPDLGGKMSINQLVERADQALYQAKQQGRDRVIFASRG